MKKIGVSSHIGDGGIALIHQMVNTMAFNWHPRDGSLDAGIDGRSNCATRPPVRSPTG